MNTLFESILGMLILVIAVVFLNPTHLLMPDSLHTVLMLGFVVFILVFMGVVWREQPGDEREAAHTQKAGRLSFLVGTAILVAGILVQATHHDVDAWLLLALSGMVLTKLFSRVYHVFKN